MIEIKDLLLNLRNLLLTEDSKKPLIIDIILKATGLELKKENLEIKGGVLYLNIKPIYKNEIFIKKDEILSQLKQKLDKKAPLEIR